MVMNAEAGECGRAEPGSKCGAVSTESEAAGEEESRWENWKRS